MLHSFAIIIITTCVLAARANTLPYLPSPLPPLNNVTAGSSTFNLRPTLPWRIELRNSNLDPPAFLELISIGRQAATLQQTYILLQTVLLILAQQIHHGTEPANDTESVSNGAGEAEFVPVEGREPHREVAATAVATLAMAEWKFGARAERAAGMIDLEFLIILRRQSLFR